MERNLKKIFGINVRHYRELLGYTQEQLAEKIGISSNTVGYIERGKNSISFTKLPALCNALKIEAYQLFIDKEIPFDVNKIDKINNLLKTATNKQLRIILNIISNILDV